MKTRLYIFGWLLWAAWVHAQTSTPFAFRDGDRVAFLGDTLLEREQYSGYMELALATHSPKCKVTFRNLGWSADTPAGVSRAALSQLQAGTESADEGWNQLLVQIETFKPTVVFLGYGMANSFAGEPGLPQFISDTEKLIDTIQQKLGKENVRFVVLSPIRHEHLGPPLPHPAAHNEQLQRYTQALQKIAGKRGFHFVPLFDLLKVETSRKASRPLTDNGIHLTSYGYQKVAEAVETGLGWTPGKWKRHPRLEILRQEILKKNALFFNQSRPQNMAYILGFRKHEQGKNAADIPMFDPLLKTADEAIHILAQWNKPQIFPAVVPPKIPVTKHEPQPPPQFDIAPGFEISLFAENPHLAKPIQMNFDPQGRLWVASSAIYPQIEPGQVADDKIIVLEDTNGDGQADKSTVFVDDLFIPTAVVPGDGGVYVGQSTELLFYKDTDGDGQADEKKIVLSGFGTEDTHHTIHTLRWGVDGQLYFNQSLYIRTDTETPNGVVRLKSGGIFHLRAPKMELDIFLRGFCNAWGHAFDEFGQSFVTDGCGSQGVSYGIRGATYFTYAGMRRELKSISPGSYPKFCSLEIIRSEHFPPDWQGNLITCDFRAHRLVRFGLEEQGSGYVTKELPELLRTTENSFRPIDVKLGPDGALYIADWSNPIINHGEVDFRDLRRDREHGRIWRVTAKGRPLVEKPKLATSRNDEALNQLLSPNDFNRTQARRILTERGDKIKADLDKWTAQQTSDQAQLEALWLYQSIDAPEPYLLQKVLRAKDGRIRAAATRVLASWLEVPYFRVALPGSPAHCETLLEKLVADPHPRVRLEAVRALAKIPSARSAELVLRTLDQPMDTFMDYAVWLSINDLAQPWLVAIQSGAWKPDGREKQLEFGLKAIEPALASSIFEKVAAEQAIPRDGSGPWIELIGQSGGAGELRRLFDQVLQNGFDEKAGVRVLHTLEEAARLRGLKPTGELASISPLLASTHDKTRTAAIKLAGGWRLNQFTEDFFKIVEDKSTSPEVRNSALESLRQFGGEKVVKGLLALAEKEESFAWRQQWLLTAGQVDLDQALPPLVAFALLSTNENAALDLWRSFLTIKGSGPKLAKALPKEIPLPVAKAALKAAREGGRHESELILALSLSANLDEAEKALTPEEMKQMAESVASQGDPARGEMIYRRAETACLTCHAIGGAGGKVGPDLTSIGASAPVDYLIESLLYPNRKIKEGYHSIQIQTKDEMEYSGILVRETDTEVVLRDATNKETAIPKNNMESRKNGLSLMPSGLVDNLKEPERLDLLRFLSELGKPGPFDASKGNVARKWKTYVLTIHQEQFGTDKLEAGDFSREGWFPIITTVDGKLLKNDLQAPLAPHAKSNQLGLYAAAQLQLASAATVKLKLTGIDQPQLWIDGKSFVGSSEATVELAQGKHTVVVRLAPSALPKQIRLEASEGTFLVE